MNKPGQALRGGEDAETTAGLEARARVRWGNSPRLETEPSARSWDGKGMLLEVSMRKMHL